MPYSSTDELPEQTKKLSSKQKRAFMHAYNSAEGDTETRMKIAWSAAKGVDDVDKRSAYAADMDEMTIEGEIAKVDADRREVFGWASVTEINGEPVVDLQNDVLETYELEKAAYDYVLHSRVGGEMHGRDPGPKVSKDFGPKQVGTLIESMVITPEKVEKMGLPEETPHGWWIGFKINDNEVWKSVKSNKYGGFSIHGLGKRIEKNLEDINKQVTDRSEKEIRGWLERMAKTIGIKPEQFAQDITEWLDESGFDDPTDEQFHDFIVETYGSGNVTPKEREVEKKLNGMETSRRFLLVKAAARASTTDDFLGNTEEIGKALTVIDEDAGRFFEDFTQVAKHLIGQHKQKDHDPTKGKNKGSHSREGHTMGGRLGDAATLAGGAGLAAMLATPGGRTAARMFGQRGAQAARTAGNKGMGLAQQGFQQATATPRRRLATAGGATAGLFGADALHQRRKKNKVDRMWEGGHPQFGADVGSPGLVLNPQGQWTAEGVVGDPLPKHPATRRLSKRQIEVLEKYLGPLDGEDE